MLVKRCFSCHKTFISTARLLLPLLAVGLLGVVFGWGGLNGRTDSESFTARTIVANEILEPRLYGLDKESRPYIVRAASGTSSGIPEKDGSQHIQLHDISADFRLDSKAPVSLEANTGTYNAEDGELLLNGDVLVKDGKGNTLNGSSAIVDVDAQTARSLDPVSATTEKQRIEAQGVVIRDGGNTVNFTGKTAVKSLPTPNAKTTAP